MDNLFLQGIIGLILHAKTLESTVSAPVRPVVSNIGATPTPAKPASVPSIPRSY